jgi:hypothetical protein
VNFDAAGTVWVLIGNPWSRHAHTLSATALKSRGEREHPDLASNRGVSTFELEAREKRSQIILDLEPGLVWPADFLMSEFSWLKSKRPST